MAQYTIEASRCGWDCLSRSIQKSCDMGKRRIPWCRPASLVCDNTGDCSMQCDDAEKPDMIPIENEGLKTFLQQENVLCRNGDVFEINMRCDECDIQVKTMRFRLPRRRKRLPCETIQEMLEQNEVEFDCIYKICDCQTDNNLFVSHCKVTNIGKGQGEISDRNSDGNRDSNKNEKTTEKKGKNKSSPRPTDGDEEQIDETTTPHVTTTSRTNKKGKRKNQGGQIEETTPSSGESSTTSTNKRRKGRKSGGKSGENEPTTGEFSTASTKNEGKGKNLGRESGESKPTSDESLTTPENKKGKGKNPGRESEPTSGESSAASSNRKGKKKKPGKQSEENEPASGESSTASTKNKGKGRNSGGQSEENGTKSDESSTASTNNKGKGRNSGGESEENGPKSDESSTTSKNNKGKGRNSGGQSEENRPAPEESSTSRPKKKDKKKRKGKGTVSHENTTSSDGRNNIEQTTERNDQQRKPRNKGFSNNPQCRENIDDGVKNRTTTLEGETSTNPYGDISTMESTQSFYPTISTTEWEESTLIISEITTEEEDRTTLGGETSTNPYDDISTMESTQSFYSTISTTEWEESTLIISEITTEEEDRTTLGGETSTNPYDDISTIESTQSFYPTILTTEWETELEESTLIISEITTEEEDGTTEATSTANIIEFTRKSGGGQNGFIDTTENGNHEGVNGPTQTLNIVTDSANGSTATQDTTISISKGMTASVTQQQDPVTLPRSGAFHETTMFNYALAGGVAGLVLVLLIILCIVLFTRDRKKKKRYLEEAMNLPPPLDEPDDEGLAVYNRKSSKRLSGTHDQRRFSKLKSFSLKKIEPPDTNHI